MQNNIRYSIETGSPATCPFCRPDRRLCLASNSGLVPDLQRKIKYCLSEDFDNCPFFLFRCLRTSPAKNYSRHIRTSTA
ncbi:hypothetical protein [Desulfuromonas sp. TF]|jgi:hypothetical protein|uniref:hypothetical protein n=1 Tax=Desulfuromonas sp. TF TaxID=1232410 RepID=UPI000408E804|nr:hypothetical protein [Desulfuromonas sp. TF]